MGEKLPNFEDHYKEIQKELQGAENRDLSTEDKVVDRLNSLAESLGFKNPEDKQRFFEEAEEIAEKSIFDFKNEDVDKIKDELCDQYSDSNRREN